MKKIIVAFIALFSAVAFGATLTPIQLLNPAGSTSGQVITSTGASTAPAWGNVTATALAAQAANTILANVTAVSASPNAVALPSCSAANSAIKYTSATGFSCGTTYALTSGTLAQFSATTSSQLLGVISDETGSGSVVFGTSPTLTTPNIVGVTNGSNAATGQIGEIKTNSTTGTNIAGTVNATSVSLTAGDWDVQCTAVYTPQATTTWNLIATGISTTSATFGAAGQRQKLQLSTTQTGIPVEQASPVVQINVSATTTAYCIASAAIGTSTMTVDGYIRARRVH